MKTPRDLLLARHHPVTPRLDAVRAQTLAAALPSTQPSSLVASSLPEWWQEVFWPVRHAWLALAALWVVILGSQLATTVHGYLQPVTPSPSPIARNSLREQLRLRAELLEDAIPAAPAPRHLRDPRRSEIPPASLIT